MDSFVIILILGPTRHAIGCGIVKKREELRITASFWIE